MTTPASTRKPERCAPACPPRSAAGPDCPSSPLAPDLPPHVDSIERGDHSIFVGEVVEVALKKQPEGRADDATLWLKDLGPNIFYGG